MVAGGSAQGPKSYSQHLQSVVAGGVTVQQRKHSRAPGWLKNTQDFCINDDLSEDTLEALGRELGLAVSGREELLELLAVIHKASGAT